MLSWRQSCSSDELVRVPLINCTVELTLTHDLRFWWPGDL